MRPIGSISASTTGCSERSPRRRARRPSVDPDTVLSQLVVKPRLERIAGKFRALRAILISGCQDNQTSMDGDRNGAFTEALLRVWADGAFTGRLSPIPRGHPGASARRRSLPTCSRSAARAPSRSSGRSLCDTAVVVHRRPFSRSPFSVDRCTVLRTVSAGVARGARRAGKARRPRIPAVFDETPAAGAAAWRPMPPAIRRGLVSAESVSYPPPVL